MIPAEFVLLTQWAFGCKKTWEVTGKTVAHDLMCVQIYTILLCDSRASDETEFQKWEHS